jgi:ferric-dicitrate binding protein FerR (iron transport regulator)
LRFPLAEPGRRAHYVQKENLNLVNPMKRSLALTLCFCCLAVVFASRAADFKQSKVTQVVNDVQIISATDQTKKNVSVNDVFTMPDILRTGPSSRAELVAEDDTVTRVGANTIFSFDPASRTIDLQQGSLLFHSPHGKGGGTIHTGSATASVLGSTLIVSATPNGGFKVISLEDQAEIKFLNGLHQKLSPGQMTYILPGGNKLAPIVVFRMDDLTQNSLLVKGFNHPLTSMPLILHEIEKQIKLIQSGKATDTGLLAGDNATSDQVEVLDANTVQTTVNNSSVKKALNADATINEPSLTAPDISGPTRIFLKPFSLPGNNFFAGQKFQGFAARNIFVNTPAANLNPLTVDLSPYAAKPEFDFVAAENLNIQGSVTFNGLSAANSLYLFAGNQVIFSPNVTLTANVGDFEIAAPGEMTLNGNSILNNVGDIGLTSGSVLNIQNGVTINNPGLITLTAPEAVNITSDSDVPVNVDGTRIITDASDGQVTLSSHSGSVTVTDTSIQTHFLTVNSGDSILLDGNGKTFSATGPGSTANFTAPNLITVNNTDLTSFQTASFASKTLVFVNDAFGTGNINLATLDGTYAPGINDNNAVVYGKANFIRGDTWNGQTIRDDSATLGSGQVHISDTSFHISKLP